MGIAITWIFVVFLSIRVSTLNPKQMLSPTCKEKPKSIVETSTECCPMPDLFSVESMAGCGIDLEEPPEFPSFRGSAECAQRNCLLRHHDLLFDNDDIDNESVKQYLEEWAAKRREYLPAVDSVKDWCLSTKPLFGTSQMCGADKLIYCINGNFYNKCPHWNNTEGCTALRTYLEDCLPYYA